MPSNHPTACISSFIDLESEVNAADCPDKAQIPICPDATIPFSANIDVSNKCFDMFCLGGACTLQLSSYSIELTGFDVTFTGIAFINGTVRQQKINIVLSLFIVKNLTAASHILSPFPSNRQTDLLRLLQTAQPIATVRKEIKIARKEKTEVARKEEIKIARKKEIGIAIA